MGDEKGMTRDAVGVDEMRMSKVRTSAIITTLIVNVST